MGVAARKNKLINKVYDRINFSLNVKFWVDSQSAADVLTIGPPRNVMCIILI